MEVLQSKTDSLGRQIWLLQDAILKSTTVDETLKEYIEESVIQRFEYCIESSWKLMKKILLHIYGVETYGPKDTIKESHINHLISDPEVWWAMIKSRNQTSHMYDEDVVDDIYTYVVEEYVDALVLFYTHIQDVIQSKDTSADS